LHERSERLEPRIARRLRRHRRPGDPGRRQRCDGEKLSHGARIITSRVLPLVVAGRTMHRSDEVSAEVYGRILGALRLAEERRAAALTRKRHRRSGWAVCVLASAAMSNPSAPPLSDVRDVSDPLEPISLASRGARFIASFFDGILFAALVYLPAGLT